MQTNKKTKKNRYDLIHSSKPFWNFVLKKYKKYKVYIYIYV